jgi:hypothetical protein
MIIPYTRLSFAGPSQPSKSDEDYTGHPVGRIRYHTAERSERDCSEG